MLRELRLKNFAVVESVSVAFAPGLNVLTGETGAGKSILIDAIVLVRGGRAQSDVIRAEAETATVEAVFAVDGVAAARTVLEEAGLDAARLRPGEEEELRGEARRLQHAERFLTGLAEAAALLDEAPQSAAERLARALKIVHDLGRLDPGFAAPAEALEAARAQVEEALAMVRRLRDSVGAEPGRLDTVHERLDALARLKRKYGDSEEAMLAFRAEAARDLERLERHEELLAEQE